MIWFNVNMLVLCRVEGEILPRKCCKIGSSGQQTAECRIFCWSQELFEIFWPLFILAGALLWAPHQKCHCPSVTIEQHEILHTNTQHSHDRNRAILQIQSQITPTTILICTWNLIPTLHLFDTKWHLLDASTRPNSSPTLTKWIPLATSFTSFIPFSSQILFSQKFCYSLYV